MEQLLVNTDRGRFEVFVSGSGEPLCVTHLYSEFNPLGSYFSDQFTDHFEVFLVNLRDAGHSCKAGEDEDLLSMDTAIADLEAIREALGFKKWAFGGHSTGGMLGLKYAINAQQSLSKMIIGGAAASSQYMAHHDSMFCPQSPLNKKLLDILHILKHSTDREERVRASIEWSNMSLYNPEKRDEYFKYPSSGKVVVSRLDYYSYVELPTYNLVDQLKDIQTPAFIYCGVHDAQCPFVFSEEIYQHLQNASLYRFEESNHSPFVEEAEKFYQMVLHFKIFPNIPHS